MNGWTDLQVDLSEPVAAHLVYMNLNSHGHSLNIQCDIGILLKGIENCKSRVVATLAGAEGTCGRVLVVFASGDAV